MKELTLQYIATFLKSRLPDAHKGNFGHAFIVAGNAGKMGAAVIAARACLRSGVGLLTVDVPKKERFILQTAIPEAMIAVREDFDGALQFFSAIAIGPGLGIDLSAILLLEKILEFLEKQPKPLLLDADALNMMSENKNLFNKIPPGTILTPHPKEFDRLFGAHDDSETRTQTAIKKAIELKIIIVLKGHKTLVTSGTESFLNMTGNVGLAKGGSGDALTGIITAFLAQGYTAFDAAKLGVFIHGLAADITLESQSVESMLITDVIENLGKAFKSIQPSAFSCQPPR